jgi:hypothetical protein
VIGNAARSNRWTGPSRFSVVIPSHLRCESVHRVLSALARQTVEPSRYEIIVSVGALAALRENRRTG